MPDEIDKEKSGVFVEKMNTPLRQPKSCICEPGDPCDYHAATCVVCLNGKCQGHPPKDASKM